MSSMRDCIAVAAFFVCMQSGHGSWYKLHIPSCILIRSVKIFCLRSTVEFSVCFWSSPRIRFWSSLTVSLVVVDCLELMLGLVYLGGLVVVSV